MVVATQTLTPARVWWSAVRPTTLAASVAPVLGGTAIALHDGALRPWAGVAALVVALVLQLGVNFRNHDSDHRRGARSRQSHARDAAGRPAHVLVAGGAPLRGVGSAGLRFRGPPRDRHCEPGPLRDPSSRRARAHSICDRRRTRARPGAQANGDG